MPERPIHTVILSAADFARLAKAEERLSILRSIRLHEIQESSYARIKDDDYILGNDVVNAVLEKNKEDKLND